MNHTSTVGLRLRRSPKKQEAKRKRREDKRKSQGKNSSSGSGGDTHEGKKRKTVQNIEVSGKGI